MAEKTGYWDVHRCTWVDAEPSHVGPPPAARDTAAVPASTASAVPEQRPPAQRALTVDAPDG